MTRTIRIAVAYWKLRRAQSALARDVERRKRENALYLKRRASAKLGWTRRALVGGRS